MNKLFPATLTATLGILAASVSAQDSASEEPIVPEASAEPSGESAKPLTTANPEIPADHLDVLFEPLTRDELLVEVVGWRDLLKDKLQEISEKEIQIRSSSIGADAKEGEEADEVKTEALETATRLREEKTVLIERLNVAIDAYEEKGGDPTEYRQYVLATSGLQVDITDSAALWAAIKGWLVSENGGQLVLRMLLVFAGVLFVFWFLASIIGRVVRKAVDRQAGISDLLKKFINKMVRRTVLFVGLLVAISALGVNVSALFALVGGGAFVVGFALQDTLSNFAAGMMVLVYRPFDVGDLVKVGGAEGIVDCVSLVSTTIRTFDNKSVLVPNKSVWGQVIINSTANDERRVDLIFGIGYDDDIGKAQKILEQLVDQHELVLDDPKPVIKVHALADSSVNFICRPWTRTENYWNVYWDLTRQVKEAFDAYGVSIPYPQLDVHSSAG